MFILPLKFKQMYAHMSHEWIFVLKIEIGIVYLNTNVTHYNHVYNPFKMGIYKVLQNVLWDHSYLMKNRNKIDSPRNTLINSSKITTLWQSSGYKKESSFPVRESMVNKEKQT